MFNFFTTSLITAATLFSTLSAPVSAAAKCTTTTTGYTMCAEDNGHMGVDNITVWRGSERTNMKVLCTGGGGNQWSANSNMSKAMNQVIANMWCDKY